jgi:hypothetical protein
MSPTLYYYYLQKYDIVQGKTDVLLVVVVVLH